eukprot:TRINITY_DN8027_c0_g1_i6.p1 TRINITY_DN8027_c0_g1~~TRINITY_DN8027_c0_g1_i6.p1  ORF type:complete len:419 (-),score=103.06 TRINITY_DN8027_c0_g1_i6:164-1420(-)
MLLWLLLPLLLPQSSAHSSNGPYEGNPFPGEVWNTDFIDVGGNQLFYYLFRCRNPSKYPRTLTLWLQGGPGYSNVIGVFAEAGPYVVNTSSNKTERNPYAWNEVTDTLFIDQPAPTNFSISRDPSKQCRNQTCVARDLHTFFMHFFDIYPEYKGVPLYITGVSYGGHYVPYLAYYLMKMNNKDFNIKGIGIGNGLIDEYSQLWSFPYTLYARGLIDFFTYTLYAGQTLMCKIAYEMGFKMIEINCTQAIFSIYNNIGLKHDSYDLSVIGNTYGLYEEIIIPFVTNPHVQAALGVNGSFIAQHKEVYDIMKPDFTLNLTGRIGYLLDRDVKTFLYFGVDDYICNVHGGEMAAEKIPWKGRDEYLKKEYKEWSIGNKTYADYKEHGMLSFIKVRNAGHTIFFNQRYFALEMLKKLIGVND